jgi:cytochrome c-type biogenesis protein CcmH
MSDRIRGLSVSVVTAVLIAIVGWGLITGESSDHDRVQALGARIKCPVCQGESIADSPSGYAQDILAFVEEKVEEGWTDDQIVEHLEARFAGIRLDPGFSGITTLLWLGPIAALGGGAWIAITQTRRKP